LHQLTSTNTNTARELEILPISKNAIILFYNKNLLQAHPADLTLVIKGNSLRREELAKIKLRNIKKALKAHLQL
jgi:hypothetical protein